jgi:hypothetical protein
MVFTSVDVQSSLIRRSSWQETWNEIDYSATIKPLRKQFQAITKLMKDL